MRSLTAAVATAVLSMVIMSSASAGDLLFTASEIAAIKAYYAREGTDAAARGDARSSGSTRVPVTAGRGPSSADSDHPGKHGRGRGAKGARGALPPGIAKNLARGKPLPPGIAMQMLPDDLTVELPAPPPGCARIIVDGKVVLIDLATRVVHDILSDVLYR
jgi:hypothetical protein